MTAIAAARKGEDELIVGNLLGSNLFNSLAVGGIAGVVGPGGLDDPDLATVGVGAMVLVGVALVFALVDLFRAGKGRGVPYFVLLVVTFALGVVNALVHGQDAWAIMPEAVVLSAVVFLLACVATWLGFSGYRRGAP